MPLVWPRSYESQVDEIRAIQNRITLLKRSSLAATVLKSGLSPFAPTVAEIETAWQNKEGDIGIPANSQTQWLYPPTNQIRNTYHQLSEIRADPIPLFRDDYLPDVKVFDVFEVKPGDVGVTTHTFDIGIFIPPVRYTVFEIIWMARSTTAATQTGIYVRFGDTSVSSATIYSMAGIRLDLTPTMTYTSTNLQNALNIFDVPAGTAKDGMFGMGSIRMFDHDLESGVGKMGLINGFTVDSEVDGTTEFEYIEGTVIWDLPTTKIRQVLVGLSAGNFEVGTKLVLLGHSRENQNSTSVPPY